MEVWLESLSMHLSVGIPLPSDLLFDIQHYKGISPSSSGSTTPDGLPSGHRSPILEPIKEGKVIAKKTENVKPVYKISSSESLDEKRSGSLKPIKIKMSSKDKLSKSCEDTIKDFCKTDTYPNYENIDFLKNDTAFTKDNEKEITIKNLSGTNMKPEKKLTNCTQTGNNRADGNVKFNVSLKTVPKNFTRNHFNHVNAEKPEFISKYQKTKCNQMKPQKIVNLDHMKIPSTNPSQVTEKYIKRTTELNEDPSPKEVHDVKVDHLEIPDVVSSTLKPSCSNSKATTSNNTFNINKSIFKKFEPPTIKIDTPKLTRKLPVNLRNNNKKNTCGDTTNSSASTSIVKSIIDTLNRKEKPKNYLSDRNVFGRSSLKVNVNRKTETNTSFRSCSPEEFTAL